MSEGQHLVWLWNRGLSWYGYFGQSNFVLAVPLAFEERARRLAFNNWKGACFLQAVPCSALESGGELVGSLRKIDFRTCSAQPLMNAPEGLSLVTRKMAHVLKTVPGLALELVASTGSSDGRVFVPAVRILRSTRQKVYQQKRGLIGSDGPKQTKNASTFQTSGRPITFVPVDVRTL